MSPPAGQYEKRLGNEFLQRELAGKIAQNLSKAMEDKEAHLDQEIERLEGLDTDDLEVLREKRRQQLKQQAKIRAQWIQMGHGEYTEVQNEMDFFEAARNSPKVVCHFYKPDTNIERKEIVDKHMKILCKEFIDIRFITANVEKVPFITARLNIFVLPSIILIKEQQMFHTLIGFEELGRKDDFTTKELAKVLEKWGMMQSFTPDWKDKRAEIVDLPQ